MSELPYKLPRIVRAKSGDWRIIYEYEIPNNPGKFKVFYVRDGINYIHDLEEKEKAAIELKNDIEYALKAGFNPFLSDNYIDHQFDTIEEKIKTENEIPKIAPWTMAEALENFVNYCITKNLKETTIKKYRSQTNIIRAWFEKNLIVE